MSSRRLGCFRRNERRVVSRALVVSCRRFVLELGESIVDLLAHRGLNRPESCADRKIR